MEQNGVVQTRLHLDIPATGTDQLRARETRRPQKPLVGQEGQRRDMGGWRRVLVERRRADEAMRLECRRRRGSILGGTTGAVGGHGTPLEGVWWAVVDHGLRVAHLAKDGMVVRREIFRVDVPEIGHLLAASMHARSSSIMSLLLSSLVQTDSGYKQLYVVLDCTDN